LLYHLMSQFFHNVHGWSFVDVLPDSLSMIVCMMSVEAGAISLAAKTRPAAGSVNVEVMTGTSGIVAVVASETITAGTDCTILGLAFEI